jgi:hypothetical protein
LAKALGCGYYHAKAADKEAQLAEWLEKGGFIVATGALGVGLDYLAIVFVLHMGMPYGMINYAQESGRAGRGGEAADSVVLVEERGAGQDRIIGPLPLDDSAMADFVESRGCRRAVMSGYLDGEQQSCSAVNGQPCDRCGDGIAEWQIAQAEPAGEWQQVQVALNEMADGCAVCWFTEGNDDDTPPHLLRDCQEDPEMTQKACDEFRRMIWYEVTSNSCMKCGMSEKYCAARAKPGQGIKCQWPNILVPVVRAAAMAGGPGWEILREVGFQGGFDDWRAYGKWLGRRHNQRVWGEWMSNAMVVLIKFVLYVSSEKKYRC